MRIAKVLFGPPDFDEVQIARHLLTDAQGVMVDVGAHHGGSLIDFAESGWRVLAFEPDPGNRATLLERVSGLSNVTVDERAISAVDGDRVAFFISNVSTGISSMAAFHESHKAATTVETTRLDSFLASHDHPKVTFLKTDTEGFDLPVLQTFPWDMQRPEVVVCEFEDRKTEPLGYRHTDLGQFLLDQGYVVFMSEWFPVVEYGRRHTWRSVVPYPAPLKDPRAWGNFIAVNQTLAPNVLPTVDRAARRLVLRRRIERFLRRT